MSGSQKQTPFNDSIYDNPYEVCFSSMKIRYLQYAAMIREKRFLSPTDKVNVFISLESWMNSICNLKDIGETILGDKSFNVICESGIINLAAHYKRFFRKYNLDTKVFIYYNDLNCEDYKNHTYEHYYRDYYQEKFISNPNYSIFGRKLTEEILPMVKKLIEFIPDVYFIQTSSIESSLVPLIVSKIYPDRKNFIITSDNYDTQYMNYDKFYTVLTRRASGQVLFLDGLDKIIPLIFRDNMAVVNNVDVFYNKMFYSMCLASIGDHKRSLQSVRGIGPKTVSNKIKKSIEHGDLTRDCTSVDICCDIFEKEKKAMVKNCRCVNLDSQSSDLTESDIFEVKNQIIDRYDRNSLEELNRTRYLFYPIMINELVN